MYDEEYYKTQLTKLRKSLEGPKALRMVGAAGGAALLVCSVFAILDLGAHIFIKWNQAHLITLCGFAGFTIFCVEMKDLQKFSNVMEWYHKWFPFLTVMWGKGLMMIFAGCLGFAFLDNFFMVVPASICVIVGFVYAMMYFGRFKKYQEEFEKSMMMQSTYHCSLYPEAAPLVKSGNEIYRSKYMSRGRADSF